jgi:hypothetical protein
MTSWRISRRSGTYGFLAALFVGAIFFASISLVHAAPAPTGAWQLNATTTEQTGNTSSTGALTVTAGSITYTTGTINSQQGALFTGSTYTSLNSGTFPTSTTGDVATHMWVRIDQDSAGGNTPTVENMSTASVAKCQVYITGAGWRFYDGSNAYTLSSTIPAVPNWFDLDYKVSATSGITVWLNNQQVLTGDTTSNCNGLQSYSFGNDPGGEDGSRLHGVIQDPVAWSSQDAKNFDSSTVATYWNSGAGCIVQNDGSCTGGSSSTPPTPVLSSFGQYRSNESSTAVAEGETVFFAPLFRAVVDENSTGSLKLEVEVTSTSNTFKGIATVSSATGVASGTTINLLQNNLSSGSYHWQARVVDQYGNASAWEWFGPTATSTDFAIDGPTGAWQMNGNLNEQTGNSSSTGSLSLATGSTAYTDALINAQQGFDFTGNEHTFVDSGTFASSTGDIATHMWVRIDQAAFGGNTPTIENMISPFSSKNCQIYITGAGWKFYDGSSGFTLSSTIPTAGQWYDLDYRVKPGNGLTVWLNGLQVLSDATSNCNTLQSYSFGNDPGGEDGSRLHGVIQDPVVWNSHAAEGFDSSTVLEYWNNGAGCIVQNDNTCPSASVLSLGQYQSNMTPIAEEGTTPDNTAIFQGTVGATTSTVQLQVEVEEAGLNNFTGNPNTSSTFVTSGTTTTATYTGLLNRSYHWQARAMNSLGTYSPWQPGGTSTLNIDFRVSSLANAASEYFNGTSSLTYSAASDTFAATDPFTIEFWYRTPNDTTIEDLIDTRNSGGKGYLISRDRNFFTDNGIHFLLNCATGTVNFYGASAAAYNNGGSYDTDGIWHQVAITKDNTTTTINAFRLYFDGQQQSFDSIVSSGPTTGNCFDASSTNSIWFGRNANTAIEYLTGDLDEVQIWNSERSSSSIEADWNQEATSTVGLRGLWHFNDSSTDLATNNGTSSQEDNPYPASSTPFGHFIEGYNSGFSYPVSIANSSTQTLNWHYDAPQTYSSSVDSASAVWNTLHPVIIASTTATSTTAGMDEEILEVDSNSGMWLSVNARTFFAATSSYPASSLVLNRHYMNGYDSNANESVILHEFGHALGLDHSYWGNIMNYYLPLVPQTTLGSQDESDYHFIWGGN